MKDSDVLPTITIHAIFEALDCPEEVLADLLSAMKDPAKSLMSLVGCTMTSKQRAELLSSLISDLSETEAVALTGKICVSLP